MSTSSKITKLYLTTPVQTAVTPPSGKLTIAQLSSGSQLGEHKRMQRKLQENNKKVTLDEQVTYYLFILYRNPIVSVRRKQFLFLLC
ncbi:hypothetical protein EON65_41330 [archaeon]|nr:MAG: hypothetical protein EON65_41330 [archaeon]